MHTKFKIIFKYKGLLFLEDFHRQYKEGEYIYNVQYTLFGTPSDLEVIQIYKGKGKDDRVYWRQRVDEADIDLKDTALIELIGSEINIRENMGIR